MPEILARPFALLVVHPGKGWGRVSRLQRKGAVTRPAPNPALTRAGDSFGACIETDASYRESMRPILNEYEFLWGIHRDAYIPEHGFKVRKAILHLCSKALGTVGQGFLVSGNLFDNFLGREPE